MTQGKYIFIGVFICGFLVHAVSRTIFGYVDQTLWANQIQYILNQDPREFDLFRCYGHPGTTLVELGSLFHIFFSTSYPIAVTLGTSVLIAGATAACSVLCYLLYPQSLWWLATALILIVNRLYLGSLPPTAIAMPFVTLIVLTTWWLWSLQLNSSRWLFFVLGVIVGLATATRFDVTLLISFPMFLLLWYRHGHRVVLPMLVGTGISFFIADPFMWFMPVQHITDLYHKFTLHYAQFSKSRIQIDELVNTIWLSVISFIWSMLYVFQRNRAQIIPSPIIVVFSLTSLIAVMVILSSRYQAVRYLFPLCIVWEVFLPLLALQTLSETTGPKAFEISHYRKTISLSIISLLVLIQLIAHLVAYLYGV
jgi:hypothetical protein